MAWQRDDSNDRGLYCGKCKERILNIKDIRKEKVSKLIICSKCADAKKD